MVKVERFDFPNHKMMHVGEFFCWKQNWLVDNVVSGRKVSKRLRSVTRTKDFARKLDRRDLSGLWSQHDT